MRVFRWENRLAVCLPVTVIETLNLREGDSIDIYAVDEHSLSICRNTNRKAILEKLRQYRARLPADFKFDRNGSSRIPHIKGKQD